MPSASDELRGQMETWFGDAIDDHGPMSFLEDQGYVLTHEWQWRKPSPGHVPTAKEIACITFLRDEWDFDGFAPSPEEGK